MKLKSVKILSLCIAGVVLLGGVSAYAADVTKTNNTDNLILASSWVGGVPPTSSDVALWDSTVTAANSVEIGANTSWAGIRITNPGGAVMLGINAAGVTAVASSATLTYSVAPSNPLATGDRAFLSGTTAPGGFTAGTSYFVVNATPTSFQLSGTSGGTAITATSAGTAVNVTGGSTLTLGASGIDTSGGSQTLTLPGPVVSGAAQNWNLVSGMTINGSLSGVNASGNDVTLTGSGTLSIGGRGMTLSNLVVNSGTVSISGSGAGIVALNGGIFSVNGAISEGLNVMGGGGTEQNIGGNRTWSGKLSGSGPLAVVASGGLFTWNGDNSGYLGTITESGNNSLRLSAVNSVSATTAYVINGTMNANATGVFNLGSLAGSGIVSGSGTWSVGALNANTDFSGNISGTTAMLVKIGTGTQTLSGANAYTGFTIVSNGVLQIGNGGSAGSVASTVVFLTNSSASTLSFNRSDAALNFTNVITGLGSVQQNGSGTIFLSGPAGGAGANNYSGGTVLNNGILKIATGALGTGGMAFTNNATLQWASGNTVDLSSQTITIGSGGGTLDVNGNTVSVANPIGNSGNGELTVKSTLANGVLNLQGNNTYTGGTTVSSGILRVNNTSGSGTGSGSVMVASGATFGGNGTSTGLVDIQNGGIFAPGNSVGTNTVGSLTMDSGSIYNFEFNANPANDQIVVTVSGGLTVSGGGFNLYAAGGVTPWTTAGTYTLINYTGSGPSLDSSWTTASVSNPHILNPQTGYLYSFAAGSGKLTVTIALDNTAVVGTWTNIINGNWSAAANWSSNPKVPHAAGDSATFGISSALRTVTLDANETNGAILFNNNNSFVIADSGKTLTLDNSGSGANVSVSDGTANAIQTAVALSDNATLSVSAGKALAISGVVSNSSAVKVLAVSGAGTVSLSGNNSYGPAASSGFGTTLSGGILQVGRNNALGAGDVSIAASGNLQAGAAGLNIANNLDIAPGAVATVTNASSLTLSGVISDSGALTKIGNGSLILGGNNTYSGDTTVNAGVLSISSAANVQNSPNLILNGGGLLVNSTFNAANNIGIGAVAGSTGTNALIDAASGASVTLSGIIASAGNSGVNHLVVNSGAGNNGDLLLSGANTFNGTTVVSNGTLHVAGTTALQNSTLNYSSGNVVFDGIAAATFGGLTGTNNLALTNLTGGIVALTVGNNNSSNTYSGSLNDGALGGSLIKIGTGTFTLTSSNQYNGTTAVKGGTMDVNGGSLVASNTMTVGVVANATLHLTNGSITVPALDLGTGGGSSSPGAVVVDSGTASFGNTRISAGSINGGSITINGGTVSFTSLVNRRDASSGTATLTSGVIINGGSTTVSNLQISTGNSGADLTVSNGSLTIGDPTAAANFIVGSGTSSSRGGFVTVRGGTLTYLGTDGMLLNNVQTSQGTAQFNGGVSTFAGITMNNAASLAGGNSVLGINGGTVYLGRVGLVMNTQIGGATASVTLTSGTLGATADWSSSAPMTLSGNMGLKAADASNVAHNITLSGVLSGAGGLTKTGNGTLTLSGTNTYTGNTTNNAGTLELQQPSLLTNSIVSVASGAALNLNFVGTNQVAALVLNGASKAAGLYGNGTDPTFLTGSGRILVAPLINPNPPKIGVSISGNVLTLNWPTNSGWMLQQQTNSLSTGLGTNWVDVPGSTSITSTNITMDPAKPTVFYRLKL